MIYRDTEDLYISMPKTVASILVKSIIQSVLSMKMDNNSDDESTQSAEFSLLQFANMLNNANEFQTHEQWSMMLKLFSPYYGEEDNTKPGRSPKDDEIHALFAEEEIEPDVGLANVG